MLSKDWKLIALVLFAMSLAACSSKKNQAAGSPYSGIWVNQDAMSKYRELRGHPDFFCATVRSNPALFGVMNGSMQFENLAMLIQGNGNVYNYSWQTYGGQGNYRDNFLFGRLDGGGRLSHHVDRRYAQSYDYAPQYAGAYGDGEIFTREGNILTRQSLGGGPDRQLYLRSDEGECRRFEDAVERCLHMWGGRPGGPGPRWQSAYPPIGSAPNIPTPPPQAYGPNVPPPQAQMGPPPSGPQSPNGAYQFGPPPGSDDPQGPGPDADPSWRK